MYRFRIESLLFLRLHFRMGAGPQALWPELQALMLIETGAEPLPGRLSPAVLL
jgi:hypothetical protein